MNYLKGDTSEEIAIANFGDASPYVFSESRGHLMFATPKKLTNRRHIGSGLPDSL